MSILYMVAMQLFKNKSPRKGTEAPKTVIMLFFHFHLKTKAPVRGRRILLSIFDNVVGII